MLSLPVLLGDCEREYSDLRLFTFGGPPKYFDGVPCRMGPGSALLLLTTRLAPVLRWKEERGDAGEMARLGSGEMLLRLLSSEVRRLCSSFDGRPLVLDDMLFDFLRCTTCVAVRFNMPGDFEQTGEGVARSRSRMYGDMLRVGDLRCGS